MNSSWFLEDCQPSATLREGTCWYEVFAASWTNLFESLAPHNAFSSRHTAVTTSEQTLGYSKSLRIRARQHDSSRGSICRKHRKRVRSSKNPSATIFARTPRGVTARPEKNEWTGSSHAARCSQRKKTLQPPAAGSAWFHCTGVLTDASRLRSRTKAARRSRRSSRRAGRTTSGSPLRFRARRHKPQRLHRRRGC